MWRVEAGGPTAKYCDGVSRRSFLQVGMAGMGSLAVADLLRAREGSPGSSRKDTSVILLWLDGGPGHMDMYDMKPEAPAEYRGIWWPVRTNVPGFDITPLFPLQARMADRFSIVRGLHHGTGDHFAAGHWMLTGRGGASGASTFQRSPFFGSMATKQLGSRQSGMPASVALPYAMSIGLRPGYFGGNFLGVEHDPFESGMDPNTPKFEVRNLALSKTVGVGRLDDRRALLRNFDTLRREVDQSGMIGSMDRFEQQAYELVTGPRARRAFDIELEDPRLRDRYGRNTWGQSTLLARRLVEAGSTFVTCHFGGWDNHWNLESAMNNQLPKVDMAVSALFEDLVQRGLYEQVLVVLCGEFSRTPRMNDGGNGGAPMSMGTPGRDHWGNSMFCLMGGGGVQGGRLVGSTDRLGEAPKDRPVRPGDIHHTIFKVLGADPTTHFVDRAGRPIPAIDHGAPIDELF